MAKDIPVGKKSLLDRVTGKKQTETLPVPPAATTMPPRQVPGIKGTPPLPVGKVTQTAGPRMTPQEYAAMTSVGWHEGDPIPQDMAAIFSQAQKDMLADASEVILPVPADTPPLVHQTVPIESLPPSEQARLNKIRQSMTEALLSERQQQEQANREAQMANLPPGVREAIELAEKVTKQETRNIPVEDDITEKGYPLPDTLVAQQAKRSGLRPQAEPKAAPRVKKVEAPPFVAEEEEVLPQESATGLTPSAPPPCPHCGWDPTREDIPEPEYHDKMSFLQALLGQKPYLKEYPLFGGAVRVTFRTLTTQEADACWKQANCDSRRLNFTSELDLHEKVNRYRVYMQTLRMESREFDHELPDGLSEDYNPNANAHWTFDPSDVPEGETPLPLVEEYMLKHVMRTEALGRAVTMICQQFNRLVSKMEAMVDNSDFWNPTEEQP